MRAGVNGGSRKVWGLMQGFCGTEFSYCIISELCRDLDVSMVRWIKMRLQEYPFIRV